MKLETPVKPGMDSLHAASKISIEVEYSISLGWLSLSFVLPACGWLNWERRGVVWSSWRCFLLEIVCEVGAAFGEEWLGVSTDFCSPASVEGQDKNGSELGRPWDLTPKA